MKLTGGGTFNPDDGPIFFSAGLPRRDVTYHRHMLLAVENLQGAADCAYAERLMREGYYVYLDSGIFALTQQHARKHDVHMDEALALAPEEIDGWDWLYASYLELVARYQDQLWGYVELDQGGADRKRETRRRLEEEEGLRPIPVYHPLNDGWDYFDELASQYDRICVGNIVQADAQTRKRILATLWERRRLYPDLRWVHALGYTPNQWMHTYPVNSCDSSAFAKMMQWGAAAGPGGSAMLQPYGKLGHAYSYPLPHEGGGPERYDHALGVPRCQAHMTEEAWRAAQRDYCELFDHRPVPTCIKGEEVTRAQ